MITLKNDFHNTEVRLNPRNENLSAWQIKKAYKTLCGMDDCTCSDDMGMRGHDNPEVELNVDWDFDKNHYVYTATVIS